MRSVLEGHRPQETLDRRGADRGVGSRRGCWVRPSVMHRRAHRNARRVLVEHQPADLARDRGDEPGEQDMVIGFGVHGGGQRTRQPGRSGQQRIIVGVVGNNGGRPETLLQSNVREVIGGRPEQHRGGCTRRGLTGSQDGDTRVEL